ncbi:TPA: DNA internalization-related competence protein ComEC/Rec2 [Proteus mirabilis]|uniref:DNA internalization-related competence protein ComEC/Rec2 n=1 Tax=Proteus mirabilis TaxID=584 RepID=UPI00050062A8|nr:DNA internalization-related competence protein ComEC/Rec2 [Proteus mirabilis]AUT92227.1 DNA internalization-related competence protein ComEC/Rec2 [Proteus mirabilis]EKW0544826.1 DNA internalization-related competence protein ComEC/Rec2 [Proteus mirabilis]EKW0546802.1 DNA internalization-related competence protein ComEC/Rec2 [Proteus mirabilis]EKW4849982.1 DNA internalization-related competence protein ComEC/Rec2 [Proteus mirabilis]EKY0560217.1 DNA internalization-related competence protein 
MILLAKIKYIYRNKIALIKWHYLYAKYIAMLGLKPLNIDYLAVIIILSCLPLLIQRETLSLSLSYTLIIVGVLLYLIPFSYLRFLLLLLCFWCYANSTASSLMAKTSQLADTIATIESAILEYRRLPDSNIMIKVAIPKQHLFSAKLYANIYWRHPPKNVVVGQTWLFKIHFRAVHGYLNEGGFDSQKYAVSVRETLSGKILSATLTNSHLPIYTQFIHYLSSYWQATKNSGEITALVLGDKRGISAENKILYMKTGISHLIVISGLHIGLAALFGWLMARGVQYLFPTQWVNPQFPLVISLGCGVFYAALSGWGIPATRAIIGLTIWVLLHWRSGLFLPWQWAIWSAAVILLLDPLAILSASFWLSFSAVFAIIVWYWLYPLNKRFSQQKRWFVIKLIHLQLGLLIILLPFQYYLFGGGNLFSLLVNLWAVPIISFITVPLIMCGLFTAFLPVLQPIIWSWVDQSINWAFFCAPYFLAYWQPCGAVPWLFALSGIITLLVIKMSWWRHHVIILITIATFLYCELSFSKRYDWRITMLDVGHGLAIIIEKEGEAVIYDTGIRWKSGGTIAKNVIIPYLTHHRLQPVAMIISHDHLDHTGGIDDLLRAYPKLTIRSSFDNPQHLPCLQGGVWQWKDLTFNALWPLTLSRSPKNNDSCVISLTDGNSVILLTGDLEKEGEAQLLRRKKAYLKADILQVPHHGSQTSSTLAFIQAISPKYALVSAARYSPWRLPSDKVHNRYKKEAIDWLTTSINGQISIEFKHGKIDVVTYRRDILPRWYHQWFGVLTFPE